MKALRIFLLALFTVAALVYVNLSIPQPRLISADETSPTPTTTIDPSPSVTNSPTPSTDPSPTTTVSPSPTNSVTPTGTTNEPTAGCNFDASIHTFPDTNPHEVRILTIAQNFSSNQKHATLCMSEDDHDGTKDVYVANVTSEINQYQFDHSFPVNVSANHIYQADMHLKDNSDTSTTCSGPVIATCSLITFFVTPSVSPTVSVSPTDTVTPTDTQDNSDSGSSDSCTSNCGDTTNITVKQEQQQQVVLAATVAPAPTTTQLPSTGADDFAVIGTLLSLLPIGWKIKKLI